MSTGILQAGSPAPQTQYDNTTADFDFADVGSFAEPAPPSTMWTPQEIHDDVSRAANPFWILSMATGAGLQYMKFRDA